VEQLVSSLISVMTVLEILARHFAGSHIAAIE
jgi:hypothetical protein